MCINAESHSHPLVAVPEAAEARLCSNVDQSVDEIYDFR